MRPTPLRPISFVRNPRISSADLTQIARPRGANQIGFRRSSSMQRRDARYRRPRRPSPSRSESADTDTCHLVGHGTVCPPRHSGSDGPARLQARSSAGAGLEARYQVTGHASGDRAPPEPGTAQRSGEGHRGRRPPHGAPEGSQTGHRGARRECVPCTPAPGPAGFHPRREEITTQHAGARGQERPRGLCTDAEEGAAAPPQVKAGLTVDCKSAPPVAYQLCQRPSPVLARPPLATAGPGRDLPEVGRSSYAVRAASRANLCGDPEPHTEPSLRERLRRPWTPPTPRPSRPLSGKGPGWSAPSSLAATAPAGTNPVQIPPDTARHSTALTSTNRHVSASPSTWALVGHSSSTTAQLSRRARDQPGTLQSARTFTA